MTADTFHARGRAAAEGVNCFKSLGIQICQRGEGPLHQINQLSGAMPCLNKHLSPGPFAFSPAIDVARTVLGRQIAAR